MIKEIYDITIESNKHSNNRSEEKLKSEIQESYPIHQKWVEWVGLRLQPMASALQRSETPQMCVEETSDLEMLRTSPDPSPFFPHTKEASECEKIERL